VNAELDAILGEIRRQGRAAVAAQAAADSCLEEVQALRSELTSPRSRDPVELARALLPLADALDRMDAWARTTGEKRPRWRELLFRDAKKDRELASVAEAVRLLRLQLENALRAIGVTADREVGVAVDGERHRVVEVRPTSEGTGSVVAIVRAGYRIGAHCVREADVIASR
jgi:molecular chaperone GrpE (heat shock protein)